MTSTPSFHPGEIWRDTNGVPINAHGGGLLRHDGVYYWFGEHKVEGEAGNLAQVGVHVYSSTDLLAWKDEGIALAVVDDPQNEIARGCILERPKVIHNPRTGKFVMWFHLEILGQGYSSARCGIAVADCVTGPYTYVKSLRPNAGHWPQNVAPKFKQPLDADERACVKELVLPGGPVQNYPMDLLYRRDFEKGQMSRDMTLFVDDDGAAYHLASSEDNGTLHLSRLSDDFLDTTGEYIRLFPGRFNEAPALMKREGIYFLITSGCTGWDPNPARLFKARTIWGPWEELENPCVGTKAQKASTFESQSTYILPVTGKSDAFVFIADRWRPENAIDGRYVWLPIQFRNDSPVIEWTDAWDLGFFDRA